MIPLLILAGGRATRLAEHSVARPKFLMPLGDGVVFADLQLRWVHEQGFREVVVSVGYKAEMIVEAIGDGSRFGLSIRYADDGPAPLGTGGAVRRAASVDGRFPTQLAILYGDTMLDIDCAEVVAAAASTHALMTVIDAPPGQQPNASLFTDSAGRLLAHYDKRAPDPRWTQMDYGLSVVSQAFLEAMPSTVPFDLAEPLMAASRAGRLAGFRATRPFQEINTPEALERLQASVAQNGGNKASVAQNGGNKASVAQNAVSGARTRT